MNTLHTKGSWQIMLTLAAVFAITSCQSPKKISKAIEKLEFKAEPEVLEVHGDSVLVTVKGKFPPRSVAKNAVIKFQPILHYADTMEMALKAQTVKGEKVKGEEGQVIKYAKGGTFTYTDKFEYLPEMKVSSMSLDYNIKLDSKYDELDQCIAGSSDTSFSGSITTSLTVKPLDDVYMMDTIGTDISGRRVIFYFVINESKLRDSAKRGPNIQAIRDIVKDTAFRIQSVTLRGYASPDGELNLNVELTKGRVASAMDFVKKELKRIGFTKIYDSSFISKPDMGEDWAGLTRLVRAKEFEGKSEVLDVLTNNSLDPATKEAELRKLSAWNAVLLNDLLPKLRRTEVIFEGDFPSRKVETLRSVAVDTAGLWNLSKRELLVLANAAPEGDSTTALNVYRHMMNRWSDDWAGKNNYAAALIKMGQYQEANKLFEELHADYPNNDTIASNLGVSKRHMRKYNDAKDLYTDAQQGGVKENNNLGILYIKYGDYESAVNSFEPDRCDYNVVLAYTLKNDFEMALQKFDCIEDKENADLQYLRAIIGARKGDKDLMTTALTRAVQLDPAIKERAKGDLEFRKFKDTSEFNNAVNK